MAEIRTVTTLQRKRDEIIHTIHLYERKIEQARVDLAHVTAAIRIFKASGSTTQMARYTDVHRILKRGEAIDICKQALASGPKTTTELATHIVKAKGFDQGDKVLAKAIGNRLIHALRMQAQRGNLNRIGKRHGVSVWCLP